MIACPACTGGTGQLVQWTPGQIVTFAVDGDHTPRMRRLEVAWTRDEISLAIDGQSAAISPVADLSPVSMLGQLPARACISNRDGWVIAASASCSAYSNAEKDASSFRGSVSRFRVLGWPDAAALLSAAEQDKYSAGLPAISNAPSVLSLDFLAGTGSHLIASYSNYAWPAATPSTETAASVVFEVVGAASTLQDTLESIDSAKQGRFEDNLNGNTPKWCTVSAACSASSTN